MIRNFFLSASCLFAVAFFAGCTSIPQLPNLIGSWNYSLTDSITKKVSDGKMELTQKEYNVTGKANDTYGEFAVSGTVGRPKFVLNFVKNDKTLSYTLNVEMTSNDTFSGTFTTTKGKAGTIEASRNK